MCLLINNNRATGDGTLNTTALGVIRFGPMYQTSAHNLIANIVPFQVVVPAGAFVVHQTCITLPTTSAFDAY